MRSPAQAFQRAVRARIPMALLASMAVLVWTQRLARTPASTLIAVWVQMPALTLVRVLVLMRAATVYFEPQTPRNLTRPQP
jgi:hypothetical protein